MTILGKLIDDYHKANLARHNLYRKRSKQTRADSKKKWTKVDEAKLILAAVKKKEISKKLTTYLKKSGMCVIWGDMNQILYVQPVYRRDRIRASIKKAKQNNIKNNIRETLYRLDMF